MVTTRKKRFTKEVIELTVDYSHKHGYFAPEIMRRDVVCSHTKRYHNCLYLLSRLSGAARDLMDYMTEEMDNENIIHTNSMFRCKFINFIGGITKEGVVKVTYSDSAVKKAISELVRCGLIRPLSRGSHKVNPEFFVRNDDKSRMEMVGIELQFRTGADTKLKVLQGLKEAGDVEALNKAAEIAPITWDKHLEKDEKERLKLIEKRKMLPKECVQGSVESCKVKHKEKCALCVRKIKTV